MGKVKIEIEKIDDESKIKATFRKRSGGLIKKAYELSVLSNVDVALITFSRDNKLFHFSGKKRRLEDVLLRFLDLPDVERKIAIGNKAALVTQVQLLKYEEDLAVEALSLEGSKPKTPEDDGGDGKDDDDDDKNEDIEQNSLDNLKRFIREEVYKPVTSPDDFNCRDKKLMDILNQVTQRKKYLISNFSSKPTTQLHEMSQQQQQQQQLQSVQMPSDVDLPNMQQQQHKNAFSEEQGWEDFSPKYKEKMVIREQNSAPLYLQPNQEMMNPAQIKDAEVVFLMLNNNTEMPIQTPSEMNIPMKEDPWNSNKNDSVDPGSNGCYSNLKPYFEKMDKYLMESPVMSDANEYTQSLSMDNTWSSDLITGSYNSNQNSLGEAGNTVCNFPNIEDCDISGFDYGNN